MNLERSMREQAEWAIRDGAELLGELHPLFEQLGSLDGLVTLTTASGSLARPVVKSYETLTVFLRAYLEQILVPLEWPAIQRAYHHASRNETRELIALDQEVSRQPAFSDFASASRRVGRCQLQRLRPLKDERVVQRYLSAVEEGRAQAWHTLVYGLTLAVYSLPIRQGLILYARQTLSGFIHAAARPLRISERGCHDLLDDLCGGLPAGLEVLISGASLPNPPST